MGLPEFITGSLPVFFVNPEDFQYPGHHCFTSVVQSSFLQFGTCLFEGGLYSFLVMSVLAGAVGVSFYPLMGSRVWCRFFCPLAAILGILQRHYPRLRITTNGA